MIKANICEKRYLSNERPELEITKSEYVVLTYNEIIYLEDRHIDGIPALDNQWAWCSDEEPMPIYYEKIDEDYFINKKTGEIYQKFITGWNEYYLTKIDGTKLSSDKR